MEKRRHSSYNVTPEYLTARTRIVGDCWEWAGGRGSQGRYGSLAYRGRIWAAHRVMWDVTHGAIPEGMVICHKCDHPLCINPDHLFLGTQLDNIRDRHAKGRTFTKTHCAHGHEYTSENTYTDPRGRRRCRTCRSEGWKREDERRRALRRELRQARKAA